MLESVVFKQKLVQSLRSAFRFQEDQVTSIELLKKVASNNSSTALLNQWVENGDVSAINSFEQIDACTSSDGTCIGYYLVQFSSVKIIISVLEAGHQSQNPQVMKYKLLQ